MPLPKESLPKKEAARMKRNAVFGAMEGGVDYVLDTDDEARTTISVHDDGVVNKIVNDDKLMKELERWQIPGETNFSQRVYTNFVIDILKAKDLSDFMKIPCFTCSVDSYI